MFNFFFFTCSFLRENVSNECNITLWALDNFLFYLFVLHDISKLHFFQLSFVIWSLLNHICISFTLCRSTAACGAHLTYEMIANKMKLKLQLDIEKVGVKIYCTHKTELWGRVREWNCPLWRKHSLTKFLHINGSSLSQWISFFPKLQYLFIYHPLNKHKHRLKITSSSNVTQFSLKQVKTSNCNVKWGLIHQ